MSSPDQGTPSPQRKPRRWVIPVAAALVVAVAAGAVLLPPWVIAAQKYDRMMKAFEFQTDRTLGGFTVDGDANPSKMAYTSGGYGAGDVQVFGNAKGSELRRLADLTTLGRAEDFTPKALWSRIQEREKECPGRSSGTQARLKRIDGMVTMTGCVADSNTSTRLRIWKGEEEVDTSFTGWLSEEGLNFLKTFSTDGAATAKLYQLTVSGTRASIALVDPGRPATCVITRWTWVLDADGLSLGGARCEEAIKPGTVADAMTEDDFAPYPSVGEWDPSDSLNAIRDTVTEAGLNPDTLPSQASLSLVRSVPALTLVAGGRTLVAPLASGDAAQLKATPVTGPALLGKPWPATIGPWKLVTPVAKPAGDAIAEYTDGTTTVTATALREEPLPPDWFGLLVYNTYPGDPIDGSLCGGALVSSLPRGDTCLRQIDGGALAVTRVREKYWERDNVDYRPVAQVVSQLVGAMS